MLYRYETHCHASECSACAHSTAQELVRAYKAVGYAGMVLTDHFIHGNTCVDKTLPWEERMKHYYNTYLEAKAEGEKLDFDVIFGLEHAYGGGQEVLCYGIDLHFLLDNPDIPQLSIDEFALRVHEYGGILIQAHPYRYGGWEVPVRMDVVDGLEIFNAGNDPYKNHMALQKAQDVPCILTSGADTHHKGESRIGKAGIALPYRIRHEKELVAALKAGDHRCVIHGEVISVIPEQGEINGNSIF
jgi:predicted metal-dependent phosphoesterase TrpH